MAVWDDETNRLSDPPTWLLTGHMVLWSDGSPAHIDMAPFRPIENGWEADVMISRSALHGTRWLMLRMRLPGAVRAEWESQGKSARARALQVLANYVRLTDWYQEDLGILDLK